RTATFLAGPYPLTQSHPSTIKSRNSRACGRGAWPTLHAGLRVGLDAIVNATVIDHSLVKQTRTGEKTF
ncbi:MAG: hypothetical protein ACLPH5_01105, partial [Candidatus Sulfotelmatobacter sp.]